MSISSLHYLTPRTFTIWRPMRGSQSGTRGSRTCPITENGLLRILSNPGYPNSPVLISDLAQRLEAFKEASADHAFWPDDFSASRWLNETARLIPSSRLTDAYLLKLAAGKNGALATFHLRIEPVLIGEMIAEILEHISA